MDKKFLACLINTRDEEPAALSETDGIDWNITILAFVVVSTSQAFFFLLKPRKPAGAGGSTRCA